MPYTYIEPDMLLQHQDAEVFHLYGHTDQPIDYWFTINEHNADEFLGHGKGGQFDVRRFVFSDTPTIAQWDDWWTPRFKTEEQCIESLIRSAIDAGKIGSGPEHSEAFPWTPQRGGFEIQAAE